MSTAHLEQSNPHARFRTSDSNEVLQIGKNNRNWLGEILAYIVLACICVVFVILGGALAVVGANLAMKTMGFLVVVASILGLKDLVTSIPKRLEYFRDHEPQLTLSKDTLCDHRTGVSVALSDVDSIRFDWSCLKNVELKANLHVSMKDGSEQVFDLMHLHLRSHEIAWKVKTIGQIETSEGLIDPAETAFFGWSLVAILAVAIAWKVYDLAPLLLSR